MNKDNIVSDFLSFIKKYDVPKNGKITSTIINEEVCYSKRHFDRIFKEYSKYTPLEVAERFRLLCCIDSIKIGNTLKDTAYDYDFTPEGLSNALRTRMNIDVKKITSVNFEFEKHMKISNLMIQLDEFKYQVKKEQFMMFLESLDEEKILKEITTQKSISNFEDGFEMHLDSQKISDFIEKYEGIQINKETYENIDLQEAIAMQAILISNTLMNGYNEFTLRVNELWSMVFLMNFFFNIGSLKLVDGEYKLSINSGIKEILKILGEIEKATEENFDITLFGYVKNDKFIVQFHPFYKEMLLGFNSDF